MNWLAPLAVLLPLAAAAVLIAVLDRIGRRAAEAVALGAALLSFAACIASLVRVANGGTAVLATNDAAETDRWSRHGLRLHLGPG